MHVTRHRLNPLVLTRRYDRRGSQCERIGVYAGESLRIAVIGYQSRRPRSTAPFSDASAELIAVNAPSLLVFVVGRDQTPIG